MRPEDLKHVKRGDSVKAVEWNALVDGVQPKPVYTPYGGNVGGQVTGDPSVNGDPAFVGVNTNLNEIPEYSVFGIIGDEDAENYDGRPLRFVIDQVRPGAFATNPMRLFTNGPTPVPGNGGEAPIKSIGNTIPRLVRLNADTIPNVGDTCGPYHLDYEVSSDGLGLICLGHVFMDVDAVSAEEEEEDEEESDSSSATVPTYGVVIAAFEASSFVVRITEEVTAFDAGTMTLGKGWAKVQYRAGGLDDEADLGDAGNPAEGEDDWEFPVYSLRPSSIPVGDVVLASNNVGVGLVTGAGGGTSLRMFQLTSNLAAGGTAHYIERADDGTWGVEDSSSANTLYDPAYQGPAKTGAFGWLQHSGNGHAEVVSIQQCTVDESSDGCIEKLGCVVLAEVPVEIPAPGDYVLFLRDGCLKLGPVGPCDGGSS